MINQPTHDSGIVYGLVLICVALYLAVRTIFGYIGGYMPFRLSRVYRGQDPKMFRRLAYTYVGFTLATFTGSILIFLFK